MNRTSTILDSSEGSLYSRAHGLVAEVLQVRGAIAGMRWLVGGGFRDAAFAAAPVAGIAPVKDTSWEPLPPLHESEFTFIGLPARVMPLLGRMAHLVGPHDEELGRIAA